ncbi:MAG: hypothetical protein WC602_02690 [archaeon]
MANSTIRDFFLNDPLARFDQEFISIEVNERFDEFLPKDTSTQVFGAFSPFVLERPWKYWDSETVKTSLNLLEEDITRTVEAIRIRKSAIDRGLQSLFRPAPIVFVEESFEQTRSHGLVRLATEFLPEYLRWAEHVFGNLIEVYWSLRKRGGVDGKFDLHGATTLLSQKGLDRLLKGYVDRVRNAIAHGKFNFTGFDIEFGVINPDRYSSSEFLRLFDDLCRTCTGLGIALLLFWARHNPGPKLRGSIPLAIVTRFAAGGLNRTGLEILGTVESNTNLAGRQLHVLMRMSMKYRALVLGDCGRVAMHLLNSGAVDYDRILVEIEENNQVSSLVTILPKILMELLENNAPFEQLFKAFPETQLLWFNESHLKARLRAWQTILSTGAKRARIEILKNWHESGLCIGKGRFYIRKIKNLSSQGVGRVRIMAVLRNPSDAKNEQLVREIIREIVKIGRSKFIRSREKILDPGIPWSRKPKYVWVDLYRVDGTLRWLREGGWAAGNLVSVAERIWGSYKPVVVDNPEEIYKSILIRYKMDIVKAQKVLSELANINMKIQK